MSFVLQPWQLLLVVLAGCLNRQQQQVIEYLRTENQVLKEKLGKKRILLTDDQRRRLAVQGKLLGRKLLEQVATIVTAHWTRLCAGIENWWRRNGITATDGPGSQGGHRSL